jgi:hypothetical protein
MLRSSVVSSRLATAAVTAFCRRAQPPTYTTRTRSRLLLSTTTITTTLPRKRGPTGTLGEGDAIVVGQYAETTMCYDQQHVDQFTTLIGQAHPLHIAPFRGDFRHQVLLQPEPPEEDDHRPWHTVVPELLVASLFSSIFGTLVPGAIYLDQTLTFDRPVFLDDIVVGRIEVTKVRHRLLGQQKWSIVSCHTTVTNDVESLVYITGRATVWVPSASSSPGTATVAPS